MRRSSVCGARRGKFWRRPSKPTPQTTCAGGAARGDELPEELARRQSRLTRIWEAKNALADRERAAEAGEPEAEARQAKPRDTDQYNFTDPESRVVKAGGGFEQAYNAQAAAEPDCQLIVGQTLTNEANDKRQLQPLVESIERPAGQRTAKVLADSVYSSERNLEYLASEGEPRKAVQAW